MKRELELAQRLRSLSTMGEAVSAMKSLSAHHLRESRQAIAPARAYRDGIERILGWSGASLGAGEGLPGLLVVGGELGLCGSYNAQVVETGAQRRAELGPGPTLCVGHRAAALLDRRAVSIAKVYGGPTAVRGITPLLLAVAEDVLTRYVGERLSRFEIVSARFGGIGVARPEGVALLPLEARQAETRRAARYVSANQFASAAAREYLYIVLYELLLDALAAEHGARLVATQAAEAWLRDRAERLRRWLAAARRESSTQEMIELAAGARARTPR